jgi:hypothetical protein
VIPNADALGSPSNRRPSCVKDARHVGRQQSGACRIEFLVAFA